MTRRARRAGLTPGAELLDRLEIYFQLLATWNQKINLTALPVADPTPEALDRLLIEPLVAAGHVAAGAREMLDIGSGGGSPAIPLALAVPALRVLLVESKTRKSVFLREAIRAVGLTEADVATARFEELLARPALQDAHDLVTIRAVRAEAGVVASLHAFLRPGGQLFLFRAGAPHPIERPVPPLTWSASVPLPAAGQLVVLQKGSPAG